MLTTATATDPVLIAAARSGDHAFFEDIMSYLQRFPGINGRPVLIDVSRTNFPSSALPCLVDTGRDFPCADYS